MKKMLFPIILVALFVSGCAANKQITPRIEGTRYGWFGETGLIIANEQYRTLGATSAHLGSYGTKLEHRRSTFQPDGQLIPDMDYTILAMKINNEELIKLSNFAVEISDYFKLGTHGDSADITNTNNDGAESGDTLSRSHEEYTLLICKPTDKQIGEILNLLRTNYIDDKAIYPSKAEIMLPNFRVIESMVYVLDYDSFNKSGLGVKLIFDANKISNELPVKVDIDGGLVSYNSTELTKFPIAYQYRRICFDKNGDICTWRRDQVGSDHNECKPCLSKHPDYNE